MNEYDSLIQDSGYKNEYNSSDYEMQYPLV